MYLIKKKYSLLKKKVIKFLLLLFENLITKLIIKLFIIHHFKI